jgi:hypothetical protein
MAFEQGMNVDNIPIWALLVVTVLAVVVAIEAGYRLGRAAHRHSEEEKVPPVSSMAGAILGLLAFMLAFTFGMVSTRYDARKTLVRDEANAIRTAWLRSDLLPEPDCAAAAGLLKDYVDLRLRAVQSRDSGQVNSAMDESARIQRQLWSMAVASVRNNPNAPGAAPYADSLIDVMRLHASRVAVALQARIPAGIWMVLYALIALAMVAVGFHTAIAGSRRSWASPIVALSFSIVIALIASLDRPLSDFVTVSQQPMADLRASMGAEGQ